jgi:voltage-gated potassium channel
MQLTKEQKQALHPINIIVFFLSLYVIVALVVDTFFPLSTEVSTLLHEIDYVICLVFFTDFLHRLFTAKNKWEYMRWGWIDLISSIPMAVFPASRLLRIFQLLRVIRAIRSIQYLSHYFLKNRIKSTFTTAAILAFLAIVFGAIGILKMEKDVAGSNIKTAEDALWWAYVTITTVGYGDKVPVTSEGRIIAAILMTVGVGLFGTFTAYVASWFVAQKVEEKEEQLEQRVEKQVQKEWEDKLLQAATDDPKTMQQTKKETSC